MGNCFRKKEKHTVGATTGYRERLSEQDIIKSFLNRAVNKLDEYNEFLKNSKIDNEETDEIKDEIFKQELIINKYNELLELLELLLPIHGTKSSDDLESVDMN